MILFPDFYGNDVIKRILNGSGHSNAFLIEGATGSGRHTLANIIMLSRLCESDGDVPCGKCRQCRKTLAGQNADIIYIDPELPIAEIRVLTEDFDTYPVDGKHKIYMIDNADALNVQKQNFLLKSLEEPPEFVTFILIAHSSEAFLKTVLSRCTVLTTRPLPDELVKKALNEKIKSPDPEKLDRAVMLGGGYVGQSLELYKKKTDPLFERVEKFADCFVSRDWLGMAETLTFSGKDARTRFSEFVTAIERYVKRCFGYCRLNDVRGLSPSEARLVGLGEEKLVLLSEAIGNISQNLNLNINLNLWAVNTVRQCRKVR